MSDVVPVDETEEQRQARFAHRFRAFSTAFDEFVAAVDRNSPFYPENIYEVLSEAIQIARAEQMDVAVRSPDEPDWYERGRANKQAFEAKAAEISALIRRRLSAIVIV